MTREQRWRNIGVLFFFLFAVALLLTESGMSLVQGLLSNVDSTDVIFTTIGLGLAFFTSESIGFIFNSVFVFLWNVKGGFRPELGGYSAEWRKLTYDFQSEIVKRYQTGTDLGIKEQPHAALEERWKKYSPDVFLSYFWQQAPRPLVEWVSRRHTVFFLGFTSIVAIVLGLLLSTVFIILFEMGWTIGTATVFVISIALAVAFGYNAQVARTEAWQMIDIWMRVAFNPQMGKAAKDIMESVTSEGGKVNNNKPSFKVMRVNDVKMRSTENDQRWYYFDSDVDIVATKISKKHTEPSHLHTTNTEIYYVMRGKLLLNIEGQDIWLSEGDMVLVNPGACHHFETTDESVTFLAIKKEPGLDDKKSC